MKQVSNDYAIEVINVTKKFKIYYDKASTLKEHMLFWKRNKFNGGNTRLMKAFGVLPMVRFAGDF